MKSAVKAVDWAKAREDVERFLPRSEQAALGLWDADFFLYQADAMLARRPGH